MNSDMDYGILNVRKDANACDCTRVSTDTVRESALKADSGRKIRYQTGEWNLRQRRAGTTLHHLSYIPTLWKSVFFVAKVTLPSLPVVFTAVKVKVVT